MSVRRKNTLVKKMLENLSGMAIQQRNNEDVESGEIKKEERPTEKFKAGRRGTEEIKEK
jgi:hypothetical protein